MKKGKKPNHMMNLSVGKSDVNWISIRADSEMIDEKPSHINHIDRRHQRKKEERSEFEEITKAKSMAQEEIEKSLATDRTQIFHDFPAHTPANNVFENRFSSLSRVHERRKMLIFLSVSLRTSPRFPCHNRFHIAHHGKTEIFS